jgi:2-polyprenyl-3-methyl-5-hydroxy-6-metoxy-1,4-benzoquinol methylase
VSPASPLAAFDPLPLKERLFVRARLFSAPLMQVVGRAPPGRIVDIGCGHGLVVALLARPDREVVGLDPDPRKIEWARASVGASPRVRLEVGTVQELAAREPGTFDAALVCDVLYLLPQSDWASFLQATRALLKPGGVLLLKEAEADRASWRYWKCLAQERVMVQVLRRTRSSGGLGFVSRAEMVRHLQDAGFTRVESAPMGRGYTTPHVLFTARTS